MAEFWARFTDDKNERPQDRSLGNTEQLEVAGIRPVIPTEVIKKNVMKFSVNLDQRRGELLKV